MWNKKRRPVRYYNSYSPLRPRKTQFASRPNSPNRLQVTRLSKKNFIFISAALVAVISVAGMTLFRNEPSASVQSSENKVEAEPVKEYKAINELQLESDISTVITGNSSLDIGVSIIDIRTGKQYTYGVDVPFIAASVGKILSACYLLHEIEAGKYTLDQQIGRNSARVQIQKMISISDNEAWRAINGELGRPALQAYAASVGIENYDSEKNTVTPSSVAALLNKLYGHQLLNKDNTSFLLANMRTDMEEIQFIRKYIDPATAVYHKAGWLDDRAHDTAVVDNGDRPYVLVIFSKKRFGDYDFTAGQKIFEELTTKTNNVFMSAL